MIKTSMYDFFIRDLAKGASQNKIMQNLLKKDTNYVREASVKGLKLELIQEKRWHREVIRPLK